MFTSVDLRFQEALAAHFPVFLTNPRGGLEKTSAVEDELADLRNTPRFTSRRPGAGDAALAGVATPSLPVLGAPPQFANTQAGSTRRR